MAMLGSLRLLLAVAVYIAQGLDVRDKESLFGCCYCNQSNKVHGTGIDGSCAYHLPKFLRVFDYGQCRKAKCGIIEEIQDYYNRKCFYFGDPDLRDVHNLGMRSYFLGQSHHDPAYRSFFASEAAKAAFHSVVYKVSAVEVGKGPELRRLADDVREALKKERNATIAGRWDVRVYRDKVGLADAIESQYLPGATEVTYLNQMKKRWKDLRTLWGQFCGKLALEECGPIPDNVEAACKFGLQRVEKEAAAANAEAAAKQAAYEEWINKEEKEKAAKEALKAADRAVGYGGGWTDW